MGDSHGAQERRIFTIGHSNQALDVFIALLMAQEINVLVDIRSQPHSRYAPQFEKHSIELAVTAAAIRYVFMGKELGGRPEGAEFYDDAGHVVYSRVEQSPLFQEGLARLKRGMQSYRVAIMCSEEDPAGCHRRLLIAHALRRDGITVLHMRGDGRIENDEELDEAQSGMQLTLFAPEEVRERKSIRSVLPRDRQRTSSAP